MGACRDWSRNSYIGIPRNPLVFEQAELLYQLAGRSWSLFDFLPDHHNPSRGSPTLGQKDGFRHLDAIGHFNPGFPSNQFPLDRPCEPVRHYVFQIVERLFGEETAVHAYRLDPLSGEILQCVLQEREVFCRCRGVARTQPVVGNHADVRHKGYQRMV